MNHLVAPGTLHTLLPEHLGMLPQHRGYDLNGNWWPTPNLAARWCSAPGVLGIPRMYSRLGVCSAQNTP